MTLAEAIKKAESGDILDMAYPYGNDGSNEPYASYILSKDNKLIFVEGMKINLEEMNMPLWSIRNAEK